MKVRDLTIPLSGCPQVSEDRTVFDAILMLEASREGFKRGDYRPRVLLVHDHDFRVIGSVRHVDMLRAFAMGSSHAPETKATSYSFEAQLATCREAFDKLLTTVRRVKVKEIVHLPTEMEYVTEDAPIEEAACRMLAGPHLHLFVRVHDKITGIIRMSDLFFALCEDIKKSGMK